MSTKRVKRAFKFRFYPTEAQAGQLLRTFGCVRLVYNRALEARINTWNAERRPLGYVEMSARLTQWKQTEELAFLNEVSSVPLQQALRHLQAGVNAFTAKRAGHPRFKTRKRSRQSAEYTRSACRIKNDQLWLAKMADPLDIRWSRPLPEGATPSTVTVSRDAANRWFVSLLVEDATVQPLPPVEAEIGVDVGITNLVTLSSGEKIANPRHERRDRQRLRRAQRESSRKTEGSRNSEKARQRVARIHAGITDRRRDHLHKLSTRLVRENQTVVIEDLTVRNLVRNHTLAAAISDASWRQFREMLEYKAAWYGRNVIVVDRWLPSSKTCSECGNLLDNLKLDTRAWTCPTCGMTHDRDVNAAINILAAGRAVNACGDGVRPQRGSPGGRSSTKQEARSATAALRSAGNVKWQIPWRAAPSCRPR